METATIEYGFSYSTMILSKVLASSRSSATRLLSTPASGALAGTFGRAALRPASTLAPRFPSLAAGGLVPLPRIHLGAASSSAAFDGIGQVRFVSDQLKDRRQKRRGVTYADPEDYQQQQQQPQQQQQQQYTQNSEVRPYEQSGIAGRFGEFFLLSESSCLSLLVPPLPVFHPHSRTWKITLLAVGVVLYFFSSKLTFYSLSASSSFVRQLVPTTTTTTTTTTTKTLADHHPTHTPCPSAPSLRPPLKISALAPTTMRTLLRQ